jgi:hypothetical protein
LAFSLFLSICSVTAQPVSLDTDTDGDLAGGSISGRVFNDVAPSDAADNFVNEGIAGVRVFLRSGSDAGEIVANRLSDAGGRFDFAPIRPGRYTLEIDALSIPARYRIDVATRSVIDVEPAHRTYVDLPIAAQRRIIGTVFVDNDGDGRYRPGKDKPAAGARIAVDGQFAVSNPDGTYLLRDLPAGRISILVTWPGASNNTHVVLYLPPGPVTNRIVNISHEK